MPLRPPALYAGLASLIGGLASAGAGSLLSLLFKGAALVIVWLAVTVAISIIAAIGYATFADRTAADVTADCTGQGHR